MAGALEALEAESINKGSVDDYDEEEVHFLERRRRILEGGVDQQDEPESLVAEYQERIRQYEEREAQLLYAAGSSS